MRLILLSAAASLLIPAQMALAEPAPIASPPAAYLPTANPTPEDATKSGDARRCVKTAQMGSRVKKRLCFTESEWARIEENAQNLAEKLQDGGSGALDGASLEGYRRPE